VAQAVGRDGRTFFTSAGTYYLTLNTTYVIIAGVILTALALGALALSAFFAYLTKPKTESYSSSYYYPPSYGYDSYQDHYYKRKRRIHRSADDGMIRTRGRGPML